MYISVCVYIVWNSLNVYDLEYSVRGVYIILSLILYPRMCYWSESKMAYNDKRTALVQGKESCYNWIFAHVCSMYIASMQCRVHKYV
jgi:hypothetical protein